MEAVDELHVRDARPEDRGAIEEVTLAAYRQYAAAMMPEFWEGYRQNIIATLADVGPAQQMVAELDGRLVGTVLLYPSAAVVTSAGETAAAPSAPEVRLLAVQPAARGRGIGDALVRQCIRRARQSGATSITLHTVPIMEAAMRMYGRLGFRRAMELDFEPMPGAIIEGYRLDLGNPDSPHSP